MDMPRCATCKWWDQQDKGWGYCEMAMTTVSGDWYHKSSKANAQGWDDTHGAYLYTDKGFGCVQHEPREDAR